MFLVLHTATSTRTGIRLDLIHVDSGGNFSKLELLQRAALRSEARMANHLLNSSADPIAQVRVPVLASGIEYVLDLAIGTPAKRFTAILDTGSDLIWTQCKPCIKCFQQPSPLFDPLKSSSFSKLPCSSALCQALPISNCSSTSSCLYSYGYGDGSSTQGVLASETLTFGSSKRVSIPHLGFGCGILNLGDFANASGLFGFGRGPLSLISQLGSGKFSYCFTSITESKPSPLLFGPMAIAKFNYTQAVTTPLFRNPAQTSLYYLSLKGITVGVTRLRIHKKTFALNKDGTGGFIIDSGTTITQLEEAAYKLVKKAFLSQLKLPVVNAPTKAVDLCFSLPPNSSAASAKVPKLIFHFHGDGADLHLTRENYIMEDSGLLCLTIVGSKGMSILGNFQQQNIHVLYDLENDKLSFSQAQCDSL